MKYITDTMIEEMKRRCEAFLEARKATKRYCSFSQDLRDVICLAKVLGGMEEVAVREFCREPKDEASDSQGSVTD